MEKFSTVNGSCGETQSLLGQIKRFFFPTGASGVGLVLVVAAVVGAVAQPAFGDAAVVAAFELISRAAVIVCEKLKNGQRDKKKSISYRRVLSYQQCRRQ